MFTRILNSYFYDYYYSIVWRIASATMCRSLHFIHNNVSYQILRRFLATIVSTIICDRYTFFYRQQNGYQQQQKQYHDRHNHYHHHSQQQQKHCYSCTDCCCYCIQKTQESQYSISPSSSSLSSFSIEKPTTCYHFSLQSIHRNVTLLWWWWCVFLLLLILINPITSAVIGTSSTTTSSSSSIQSSLSLSASSSLSSSSLSSSLASPIAAALAAPAPAVGSSILEQFTPNCSAVTYLFQMRGFDANEIPQRPNNEMGLRYCESPNVGTCCTHNMETKMAMKSRLQLEKHSRESITKMSHMLSVKVQKYNEIFDSLLRDSKADFNLMFTRTYGVIYQQNSYVFGDLFKEFEAYYKHGNVDLINVMDKFFNTLYQKMFTVLNAQYYFDDKYLRCVGEHMKELKPFGDVPDKLSVQIKRSFVATRTYGQALAAAAEASKKLITVRLNPDCTTALTKMQHCGSCKGYVEKPCTNYCINVIKGCLNYLNEFDIEWENFVQAMDKLAERLLGSFNIVMVVEPINIKISEAIMNFQDTGHDITNRVFQGCGRPSLSRPKRTFFNNQETPNISISTASVNSSIFPNSALFQMYATSTVPVSGTIENQQPTDLDILDIDATLDDDTIVLKEKRSADPEPRDLSGQNDDVGGGRGDRGGGDGGGDGRRINNKKNRKNKKNDYSGGRGDPELDKSIRDIRQRVKDLKKFWLNLSQQYCTNDEISTRDDTDGMCWNGHTIDRYMHSITTEYGTNPEFPGNPTKEKQTALVHAQVYHLRNAVTQLRNAYNGQDVIWREQESDSYFGSGSGSGTDTDDEDYDGEGSGLSPLEPTQQTERPSIHFKKNNINDEFENILNGKTNTGDSEGILTHTTRPYNIHDTNRIDDDDIDLANNANREGTSDDLRGSGSTTTTSKMSLRRALLLYLVPLYMAWFGGIITEAL